ncbi:MAG: hypothetical protein A2W95_17110 [Bacteroidetes bacterium GWA2_40_14]|nr:MAG: hypothetical protein A2W95_17110 [Bacteroidetes bacterium GWA2_40_14]
MISNRFVTNRDIELESVNKRIELQNEINDLYDSKQLLMIGILENYSIDSLKLYSIIKIFKNQEIQDSLNNIFQSKMFVELLKTNNKISRLEDLIQLHTTKKEDSDLYSDFVNPILVLGTMLGLAFFIAGFYNWYNKHQRLVDNKLLIEYVSIDKVSEICQSCGKRMFDTTSRPFEKDGKLNFKYCTDCYENGSFIEPEITLEQMKAKIYQNLRIKNKLSFWWRIIGIKYLRRWKN